MKKLQLRHGFLVVCVLMASMILSGCYQHGAKNYQLPQAFHMNERLMDSLSFFSTHHYTNNYNFVVKADSLPLIRQLPEETLNGMQTDTFSVKKGEHLVVADIRIVPTDSIDTVWVQLANDTSAFGWSRECNMLPKVMPDDPISQFISAFSDAHTLIFLIIVVVFGASYLLWWVFRQHAYIVHFHDIDSFYPTLLCLIVASSATFYATLQMFAPQLWQHFYFHPTLNPFSVPWVLGAFLLSVWVMLIVALAAADEVRHALPLGEAILYLGGLVAVCAVNYILFSITTLYYVGYLLLIAYFVLALRGYMRRRARYVCGNCGTKLQHKGRCPYCGTENE